MTNLESYGQLIEILLKAGGFIIGIAVAVYIKPLSKSITNVEKTLSDLKSDMSDISKSLSKINGTIDVMIEKHKMKESQIEELKRDMRSIRDWRHDVLTEHLSQIQINVLKIEDIQEKIGGKWP